MDYVDVFKKMAEARKTTMGHITQDHLQQSTIAIPDNKDIADKFEELISPIFRQIIKLQEEISNLTKQRDELLPLLMNGQVSVNSDLAETGFILFCISSATKVCFQLIKSIIVNSVLIIAFYINP